MSSQPRSHNARNRRSDRPNVSSRWLAFWLAFGLLLVVFAVFFGIGHIMQAAADVEVGKEHVWSRHVAAAKVALGYEMGYLRYESDCKFCAPFRTGTFRDEIMWLALHADTYDRQRESMTLTGCASIWKAGTMLYTIPKPHMEPWIQEEAKLLTALHDQCDVTVPVLTPKDIQP